MTTIALLPQRMQPVLMGIAAPPQYIPTQATTPGTERLEEEDDDDDDEEYFFEDEDDDYPDEDKPSAKAAITRLTIAIIPVAGTQFMKATRSVRKRARLIDLRNLDLSNTDMVYDDCDKPEVYARISAKLGKTKEELQHMLFGFQPPATINTI